jgi:hypothetical protein
MNGSTQVGGGFALILDRPDISRLAAINGGGMADILWQNDNGQALWFMNCTGIVGQQSDGTNRGQSWHVMDSRDFNATGSSTLPWQGDNGQPAVWLMDDAIQVGRQRRHRGIPAWHIIA